MINLEHVLKMAHFVENMANKIQKCKINIFVTKRALFSSYVKAGEFQSCSTRTSQSCHKLSSIYIGVLN